MLGARIRDERLARGWSLTELSAASGVSRAMVHRIERGDSSPTATTLGKLSGAFALSLSALLDEARRPRGATEAPEDGEAHEERAPRASARPTDEARIWTDPATGYTRRALASTAFPVEVTEIELPAGARVDFTAAAFSFVRQLIWVIDGALVLVEGDLEGAGTGTGTGTGGSLRHELGAGESLELGSPRDRSFENAGHGTCRYAVVLVP